MTKFLNHTRIKTVVGENGNIGKWEISGRITYYLSNLLQKEGSTLTDLYLNSTGMGDEEAEILSNSLKHNPALTELYLDENNITERGYNAILKLMVDVSSIESTYSSNNTLSVCGISNNASTRKLKSLIESACELNQINTPEASGRAKVIKYHLSSQTMKELCELQDIEYTPGSIFADIEPVLLPDILALIGRSQGQRELYTALIHTAPDVLSYIDRKALIDKEMEKVEARGITLKDECVQKVAEYQLKIAEYEQKMASLKTEMLTETSRLNDKKADLSSRLALIDLDDKKQSADGKVNGVAESSKKRQSS